MSNVHIDRRKGGHKLGTFIAISDDVQAVMDAKIAEAEAKASATLAAHYYEGDSFIETERAGNLNQDRMLILNDERGLAAALAIELGTHRSRGVHALSSALGAGGGG